MLSRTFGKRLERAEQIAKTKGKVSPDCICFPGNEQPFFASPQDQEIAVKTKCPIHGERFQPRIHIYVAQWRIENEKKRWLHLSPQYHKAWHSSFSPGSWPESSPEL
jgi:hypothetical protein